MSNDSFWSKLRHFKKTENWGDASKMDVLLLMDLDRFREEIGHPFKLLAAYATSGHSEHSFHYLGRAVDGRFHDRKTGKALSAKAHLLAALKSPFNGIGIYLWGSGGPFIHLDNRPMDGTRKVWVSPVQGKYENLTEAWMSKIFKA